MKKITFILVSMAFLAGCNEQEVVQPSPAVAVAPAPAENPIVHNEQITIPDRAISKKTGDGKY